jgi:hypothetical protein
MYGDDDGGGGGGEEIKPYLIRCPSKYESHAY